MPTAMLRLLSDRELAEQLGRTGREHGASTCCFHDC
jgi:hypothetical protein